MMQPTLDKKDNKVIEANSADKYKCDLQLTFYFEVVEN